MNYSSINSITLLFFIFFNPFYALFVALLVSITTNRLSNLLLGILYVLSFALLFTNQEYLNSDLREYIDIYQKTEFQTFLGIFKNFLLNPHHNEFLWLFYNRVIGLLTGHSNLVFLFTTYMLIFASSAYLAFLFSENGRYNFALMLFALILFDMTFLNAVFNLWRNLFSVLIFLIGVQKYFSFHSKLTSRVILYSAVFFHISAIPLIGVFELYVFFMNTNNRHVLSNIWLPIKLILFICGVIVLSSFLNNFLLNSSFEIATIFSKAIKAYEYRCCNEFNFMDFIRPIYIMLIFYIIYNWKNVTNVDLFIIVIFLIFKYLSFNAFELGMLYSRATLFPQIGILFISIKALSFFNYRYIILFVCIVFFLRIAVFIDTPNLIYLKNIGNGDPLNPFLGLLQSITFLYSTLGYGL